VAAPVIGNADDPLFRTIDADDFPLNGPKTRPIPNLRGEDGLVSRAMTLTGPISVIDPATKPALERSLLPRYGEQFTLGQRVEAHRGPDGVNPCHVVPMLTEDINDRAQGFSPGASVWRAMDMLKSEPATPR